MNIQIIISGTDENDEYFQEIYSEDDINEAIERLEYIQDKILNNE